MQLSTLRKVRRQTLMLALATLPMLGLWASSVRLPEAWGGLSFIQWHMLLELASVGACAAIAAVAWNARELEVPRSVHLLGSACLGALLLDAAHMLSSPGLPGLLGSNTANRTVALFMAGRLLIALALLGVAALSWHSDRPSRWARWSPFGMPVCALAVVCWAFAAPGSLPLLVRADESLTVAARAVESVVIGLFLVASLLFARRMNRPQPFDVPSLLCAAVLMAIGEAALAAYTRFGDLALVAGHVYKVLGFWMLYRTIVADSIRTPYRRLMDSRQKLRHNEEELRTITDNIPAMVAFVDNAQCFQFVNRNYKRWLGLEPQSLIGRKVSDVFGAEHCVALQPHLDCALAGQASAVDHRIAGIEFARGRWLNMIFMPKVDTEGNVSGVYIVGPAIFKSVQSGGWS